MRINDLDDAAIVSAIAFAMILGIAIGWSTEPWLGLVTR